MASLHILHWICLAAFIITCLSTGSHKYILIHIRLKNNAESWSVFLVNCFCSDAWMAMICKFCTQQNLAIFGTHLCVKWSQNLQIWYDATLSHNPLQVMIHQTTWHHTREKCNLYSHLCDNFDSCMDSVNNTLLYATHFVDNFQTFWKNNGIWASNIIKLPVMESMLWTLSKPQISSVVKIC